MRFLKLLIFILALANCSLATAAEAARRPKLAVMPLKPLGGVSADVAEILTGIVTSQVTKMKLFDQVISAEDIDAVLKAERMKDALGCNDVACAAEIGGALGADETLVGRVGRLGSAISIQLTLFDNRLLAVAGRGEQSVKNDEDLYKEAVREALSSLFGQQPDGAASGSAPSETIGERPKDWVIGVSKSVVAQFVSVPPGAIVFLDGKLLCSDSRKACSRNVSSGPHMVTMHLDKYEERSELVNIEASKSLHWELTPTFGWLSVTSEPDHLRVRVDGEDVGETPLHRLETDPGPHTVVVEDQCFFTTGIKTNIARSEERELHLQPPAKEGAVSVTAEDEKGNAVVADVLIDGATVGTTPGTFKSSICSKQLAIKQSGWEPYSLGLELQERQVLDVRGVLNRSPERPVKAGQVALWAVGGAGVAASGILALVTAQEHANAIDPSYLGRQVEAQSGIRNQRLAIAAASVGAGAAAAGLIWWLVAPPSQPVAVLPAASSTTFALNVSTCF